MNAVEVKNVRKNYKSFSLNDVSFALPSGCIMGLIGENGAGKSTLIKLILRNIQSTQGEISVFGNSSDRGFYKLRQDIGVVPDAISFPSNFRIKQVQTFMRLTFDNWDDEVFNGYIERFELPRNEKFKNYSLGMKKKLGIAVALSHNAKLLILDEASNGLDPVARDDFLDILYEFTRDEKHSVLFSSHIVSDLEKLCDYIAVLHNGELVLCEEKDALLDKYRMINCGREELEKIPVQAIVWKRLSPYGVQAVVKAEAVPRGTQCRPVTVEELFVFMINARECRGTKMT